MTASSLSSVNAASLAASKSSFDSLSGVRKWLLLAPTGVVIGFLLICTLAVLRMSFGSKGDEWTDWTLANYIALDQRLYLRSLWTTTKLSALSAVFAVLLAFPIALCITRVKNNIVRRLLLISVLLPMLLSLLVQSYGWIIMLGPDGIANEALRGLGLIERPILFLFSETGVLLGLIQTTIPFAVLPIASSLRNIPRAYEEAASVLGAPRWRVYASIIIPLAMPGVLAGSILVFGFNMGTFVVPILLGGLRVTTLAVLIRDQMGPLLNWPFGAAISVVLIVIALIVQALYQYLAATREKSKPEFQ